MENLKEKMANGLLWGALNNGGMQLLNILFGIVIARRLTPGDFGLVAMLTVFSSIAANLQESGFINALINRKDASRSDFCSVFWFNVVVSAFLYVVLWFCAPLIALYNNQPVLTPLARYAFTGFFFASFSIVPRTQLMKALRVKDQTIISLVSLLLSGTVGIIMAVCDMAYWGLATQNIVYVSMVSVLSWRFTGWRPAFLFSLRPIREMFGFSVKMLITNIVGNLNKYAFETLMGGYYPKHDVGQYSQANKWNQMGSSFITGMVQGVAQPMFVAIRDDGRSAGDVHDLQRRYQRAFRKMLRFICFISFPVMFGLVLIAPELIVLTVTDKYLESARLMQIICIGGAFLPVAALYTYFIISRGQSNIFMWNMIAQVLLILADLFAVQHFGLALFGLSGIRLMITIYVVIIVSWTFVWHWFVWKEISLSLFKVLTDIVPFLIIAAATMAMTYFCTREISNMLLQLITRILMAATVYFSVLWLLKAQVMRECVGYLMKRTK
ncbi:MAG: lipopolysaccharide biosynthesis protein [Bacteroidaceae bacterium]|nr:lipopolysaccharide biosynthesis protein [Bacteroidaceae bacterium]